jgi:hypothetical protein
MLSNSLVFSVAVFLPEGVFPLFGAPETFWRFEVALFSFLSGPVEGEASGPVEGEDEEDKLRVFVSPAGRVEGTAPKLPVGENVVEKEAFSGDRNG